MKKLYPITVFFVFLSFASFAQLPTLFRQSPPGYTFKADVAKLSTVTVEGPSEVLKQQIISGEHPKSGEMYIIAQNMPVSLDMENAGTWTSYPGFKTWRLKIKSEGAEALALLYSKFRIPQSAAVYVYNSTFTHKSRPYTAAENPAGLDFSTEIITGNETVLEYWVPETETEQAVIELEAVSYVFRGGERFNPKNWQDNGASDGCQVNMNCSEGSNWQNQKRGVAKIFVIEGSSGGLCTGTLVNNTAQDCKNYFLTAQHCGGGASAGDLSQWQFYFNFESPNCSDLDNTQANAVDNQTVVGCTRRASSGTISDVQQSDFLLVEFNAPIPSAYNVYYNGWDRNGITPAISGVGIHHPSGDIKKISTYGTPLLSSNWTGTPSGSHWQVSWTSTANGHGVTEPGSSGSPLFNQAKRIVGDLSGGLSYCSSPDDPDLYGKFSYSWQTAGANNNQRLSPWLDPANTGAVTLDGKNACSGGPNPTGSCDTLSHFINGTHTPSALTAPGGTGWLAGTNSYNDKAKAEFFSNTFPANSAITGFFIYFHTASGPGNVTFKVWNAAGAGGSPGSVLAQGDVPIANIPTDGTPVFLNLSANPLPITGGFYIGFDIPGAGNEVGMYTTAADEVNVNTGWEQYEDNSWHSYEESYGAKFANIVYVTTCNNVLGVTEAKAATADLRLFPNPASDFVQILTGQSSVEPIWIRVTDMTGKTVAEIRQPAGTLSYRLDVQGWADGVYGVRVYSGHSVCHAKFVKN